MYGIARVLFFIFIGILSTATACVSPDTQECWPNWDDPEPVEGEILKYYCVATYYNYTLDRGDTLEKYLLDVSKDRAEWRITQMVYSHCSDIASQCTVHSAQCAFGGPGPYECSPEDEIPHPPPPPPAPDGAE